MGGLFYGRIFVLLIAKVVVAGGNVDISGCLMVCNLHSCSDFEKVI